MVDYLMDRIYDAGAHHVFFVPGTGCMFLTDALARKKELTAVSVHHEQAAGMAALTYAKRNETLGACVVTTGCGGTNAMTALLSAWQDSVPCVFISGQATRAQTVRNSGLPLRQMGRQEADIIALVSPICKYAVMINSPDDVVYQIDKALYLAGEGRKGPVWLDVPMDIQNSVIDSDSQRRFVPERPYRPPQLTDTDRDKIVSALSQAQRPILLVGNGVRLAGAVSQMREFVQKYRIPVAWSRLGHDLVDAADPLSVGMIGMLGSSRAGNFAVANCDLLLCVGCRLSINTTGYEYEKFARAAKICVVDIDEVEHQKNTVRIDTFIAADALSLFKSLSAIQPPRLWTDWAGKCLHWKEIFPLFPDPDRGGEKINLYSFVEALSQTMPDNATVVSDAGSVSFTVPAAIRVKPGQRSIASGAQAEMGYSLPGAIGAAFAGSGPVIAVNGDGSVMMNLQELQTLSDLRLPVKVCIINNNGYASIREMQKESFRRVIGCDPQSGLGFPDFAAVARAFRLPYLRIEGSGHLAEKLRQMFLIEGPVLCELMCAVKQDFLTVGIAKNKKGRLCWQPLENLSPFIDQDLYRREMIIPPLD